MTKEAFTPEIEKIKATSAKVKTFCDRMDAEILILIEGIE